MTDSRRSVPLLRIIDADDGLADAYNALERDELSNRQTSMDTHSREISAWLGGIGVLAEMLAIEWDLTGKDRPSERIQVGMISLALSSSKTAFDATLAGHYSAGFASCRMGFESAFMIIALELAPDLATEWYRDTRGRELHLQSPRIADVLAAVQESRSVADESALRGIDLLKKLSTLIHQTSIGTHPTKDALYPLVEGPHDGVRPLIRYREENAVRAMGYGIYLCSIVASAARLLRTRVTQGPDVAALIAWGTRADEWARQARGVHDDIIHRVNNRLLDQT